jgi:hypothetical protein
VFVVFVIVGDRCQQQLQADAEQPLCQHRPPAPPPGKPTNAL